MLNWNTEDLSSSRTCRGKPHSKRSIPSGAAPTEPEAERGTQHLFGVGPSAEVRPEGETRVDVDRIPRVREHHAPNTNHVQDWELQFKLEQHVLVASEEAVAQQRVRVAGERLLLRWPEGEQLEPAHTLGPAGVEALEARHARRGLSDPT